MTKRAIKIQVPRCSECEAFNSSIFCALKNTEVVNLSNNKSHCLYRKGQLIFHEGQQPQTLFSIFSGKVLISKQGDDGKEQIVRFAKKGDVIGYRALLGGDNYFASATAIEETIICCFPKHIIEELLDNNPKFARQTIILLSKDLRVAEQNVLSMAQKEVRARIAEVLLMLKEYYGIDNKTGTINTNLSREEIANIAGTTTATCIRILSEFNRDRVIKLIGKSIKISNMPKLNQLLNNTLALCTVFFINYKGYLSEKYFF